MFDTQEKLRSSNPNAPKISHRLYLAEKEYFTGSIITSILYGTTTVLFFKCVAALLNPAHRRGKRIKWGLISYTMVLFSFVTVQTTLALYVESICYIDNREFPGTKGVLPGPLGCGELLNHNAVSITSLVMYFLNGWLADGLLLYRCYIIYSMSFWAITFPCLMYLGSLVMGIMYIYQTVENYTYLLDWAVLPYYWMTLSLNVLLTLMICIRIILQTRKTRTALGIAGVGRLCNTIVTMLVESCALYAVSLALIIGAVTARNAVDSVFTRISPAAQVIASLLIIQRVANKSALTSNTVASGHLGSFNGRELTGGGGLPGGHPINPLNKREVGPSELLVGVKNTIDCHQDNVSGRPESDV